MRKVFTGVAGLALAAAAFPAGAYCIHNDLKDRSVTLTQEEHPAEQREEKKLKSSLRPGTKVCCEVKNLDCNPNGRANSLVGIFVTVESDPPRKCGPAGVPDKMKFVKVMGAGEMRIVANPRFNPKANDGVSPYVVRVWSHDKQDITGPSGLPCR